MRAIFAAACASLAIVSGLALVSEAKQTPQPSGDHPFQVTPGVQTQDEQVLAAISKLSKQIAAEQEATTQLASKIDQLSAKVDAAGKANYSQAEQAFVHNSLANIFQFTQTAYQAQQKMAAKVQSACNGIMFIVEYLPSPLQDAHGREIEADTLGCAASVK